MNKKEILEKIEKESNRLDTLTAIRNYYIRENYNGYKMEQCEKSLQSTVDKLFELRKKL